MMMLDETKNDQINSLTKDFNYIVYSYWGIIVFAVISLFGLLVNASRKLNKLSIFLVSTIFISLISSGLLIIFELLLYGKLNNSMIFSYSEIISPFHYYYITLGSGFFCLYLSAFSSYKITPSLIQEFKKKEKIPKQKKEKKVKDSKKEKIKKEEKTKIKKEIEKQEPVKIPDKPPEIVKRYR